MKFIVAGSRDLDEDVIYAELVKLRISDHHFAQATEIVSGRARGADTSGERYAEFYDIPLALFPADWDTHGKAAGAIRNKQMALHADAAVIFMKPGGSPGSNNMRAHMNRMKKPVYVFYVEV